MARITPDQARAAIMEIDMALQGLPKPRKPDFNPSGQGTRQLFRCPYCRRYGAPGICEGCGAPNEPAQPPPPARRPDLIEAIAFGVLTPNEVRALLGRPTIPSFEKVRR